MYETEAVDCYGADEFWVRAGGLDKHVTIFAPGPENYGPDAVALDALYALAEHLLNVEASRSLQAEQWVPDHYWGSLSKAGAVPATRAVAWPWSPLTPEGFAERRVMSSVEVAMLGLDDIAGGVEGIQLRGPDGKTIYSFSLWPILPDEVSP